MSSGQAHGWLFVDLINVHLADHVPDEWDKRQLAKANRRFDELTTFCPECCGPCHALHAYWNTPRGRAEAQTYVSALPKEAPAWTWCPGGVIDWAQIEQDMANGWCPNHEEN